MSKEQDFSATESLIDVQVDRLVGPTHHFGGLGLGNVASIEHKGQVSHPAKAAFEGLDKMQLVANLGVPQVILPPQLRPADEMLLSFGFNDHDASGFRQALQENPFVLSAFFKLFSNVDGQCSDCDSFNRPIDKKHSKQESIARIDRSQLNRQSASSDRA